MRAYGVDVEDYTTNVIRECKKGRSILIDDGYADKFRIQDVLQMVYLRKATEDEMKYCPVVVLKSDIVWNSKDISDHSLDRKSTSTWDPDKSKRVVDINMRDIIKYRLEYKTTNHQVDYISVEKGSTTNLLSRGGKSSSYKDDYPYDKGIITKAAYFKR